MSVGAEGSKRHLLRPWLAAIICAGTAGLVERATR